MKTIKLLSALAAVAMMVGCAAPDEDYTSKVGDLISGEVYQVWKREVLILDEEDNELVL